MAKTRKRSAGKVRGVQAHPKAPELVRKVQSGGRPRFEVTEAGWAVVEEMARDLCTVEEVADYLGVSKPTLLAPHNRERFERTMRTKRAATIWKVRTRQREKAEHGNPVDSIWFGKQHLGQSDRQAITGADGKPLEVAWSGIEMLGDLLDRLEKRKHTDQPEQVQS